MIFGLNFKQSIQGKILAKSGTEKKKQKRKAKKKQIKAFKSRQTLINKAWFYLDSVTDCLECDKEEQAIKYVKQAAKIMPYEKEVFYSMGFVATTIDNDALKLEAITGLERIGKMNDNMKVDKLFILYRLEKFKECSKAADNVLENFTSLKIKNKRPIKKEIIEIKSHCQMVLTTRAYHKKTSNFMSGNSVSENRSAKNKEISKNNHLKTDTITKEKSKVKTILSKPQKIAQVPITCKIEIQPFLDAFCEPVPANPETYELALQSHQIRFTESFGTLICLPFLTQIKSFWYQEETAKKVLKQFRGRALLSDEVGLGKTIEALIILTEYIKRGMVKTCLILTPTPLVSQWKDEMQSKFNMDVLTTDDASFKSGAKAFWQAPCVIASINQAKSKKNFDIITAKQYDIIIVDEAHHLKNRTTLNWKLVNSLKKRFILLLTATPVENNLMELYNLITLLKPGQLETATSFKKKFMQHGDPTNPVNKALLKELLSQVMIRNTRALASINIPARFAQTIRIELTNTEKAFYKRLETLILSLNAKKKGKGKMIVKNLLAMAGSSPTAVETSLTRMLQKEDYIPEHEKEIMAVKNLCRTTLDTSKNMALFKVIKMSDEKLIVFVKYKGTIEHVAEFLEWHDASFSLFHGAMTNKQKDEAIETFKNKTQVLITTEIGGEGRNLQFCSRMINYDLPWNPMKIEQRIGRIHRIGQKKEVEIFNFCAAGSIEDYILDILDRKINMFEMVIGEIDMILGRIKGDKEFSEMVYDIWINSENKQDRQKSFTKLGTKLKRAKTGYDKTRELDDKLFGDIYEL